LKESDIRRTEDTQPSEDYSQLRGVVEPQYRADDQRGEEPWKCNMPLVNYFDKLYLL